MLTRSKVASIQKQIDALEVELTADNAKVQNTAITQRIKEIKAELVTLHAEIEA